MTDEPSQPGSPKGAGPAPIPLSRFRAALARPAGAKRVNALLAADDPEAAVRALSVPDLYFLVYDVGLSDCYELVALASPEQVQGLVDMDIWERDRPQLEGLKPWLAALMDAGLETLERMWRGLDPELTSLALARWAQIWDHSLGEAPPDDDDGPFYSTPDTFFTIKINSEREDDQVLVLGLLDQLYKADMDLARHTVMAARSEPYAELEEYAYRWRSGRMADLGYVDFYEALEVFRPLDPDSVHIGEDTADRLASDPDQAPNTLPVRMVEGVVGRAFLARALDSVHDGAEAERLEAALLLLVNRVLSAARVSPGDEEAIAVGTEHATATLALGLEAVSGGDLDRAVEALGSISLTRLHRVGYTMTLRLGRLARTLAPRAGAAGALTESVLRAALRARPFFSRLLDDPPVDDIRPFESAADLQKVASHLAELAFRIATAEALGIDVVALADTERELDDYLRTGLVRTLGGGEMSSQPLGADELRAALDAFEDGALSEAGRERAAGALTAVLDEHQLVVGREHLPRLVQRWLGEIEEQLGGLSTTGESPDPRFLSGIVLRTGQS